ncbi:MAG: polyphosphate kinase 2 family protein [Clostridiales bacterium]|jgi:PPK2 family polyphosphate:nucleotide phosphotransferase|nr:polyphosphate kinase 2 family protein [Clostridiales bacterium]
MNISTFRVAGGEKVAIGSFSTRGGDGLDKKEVKRKLMPENIQRMAALQERLFAENQHALLIVLQAMDAAGKDGTIKHVMTGLNPQGTQVVSFKVPSSEENDHDYLWRVAKAVPRRGEIGIFNRSHYEDVIVARVHDLVRSSQIPQELITGDIWEKRYRQIRDFERYLGENGITVVKIFLHLSKDEQRERLLARILEEDKNWKFNPGDIQERRHWDKYQAAYEHLLNNTSTPEAPWYVVPADRKWFARYLVSEIVLQALERLDPRFPELSSEEHAMLAEGRKLLEEDA